MPGRTRTFRDMIRSAARRDMEAEDDQWRDHVAAMVLAKMAGAMAGKIVINEEIAETWARKAYLIADAMLRVRDDA